MKVFMLGWEFPPYISGGLGTACYGMTKGLDEIGVDVAFVLPTAVPVSAVGHVSIRSPSNLLGGLGQDYAEETRRVLRHVKLHQVPAALQAYASPGAHKLTLKELLALQALAMKAGLLKALAPGQSAGALAPPSSGEMFVRGGGAQYNGDLIEQVRRYAALAVELAAIESFDVVHAHDWMTYPAGVAVKNATGKPLVVHVHSTEFDRSGDNINQHVYDIERMGMHAADMVVCVSHLTRRIVTSRYGVPADKVEVVYNAVDVPESAGLEMKPIRPGEKIVLFLGRVTMQKGPEYFLRAAKKVVEKFKNVRFVIAGSGDMITRCIEEVAYLGIGRHVTFTGFLRGKDVDRVFQIADLYVMPSVSEPFGIAPLEALSHNVPVIISKQSGVSEVLTHALKVDFWDIDEMANKILAVLRHAPLQRTLGQQGHIELQKFSWRDSALQLKEIYQRVSGHA